MAMLKRQMTINSLRLRFGLNRRRRHLLHFPYAINLSHYLIMLCRSDVDDIKSVIETCPKTNAVRLNYLYGKLHLNIHTIDYHY